jgi:hypothetical protein
LRKLENSKRLFWTKNYSIWQTAFLNKCCLFSISWHFCWIVMSGYF